MRSAVRAAKSPPAVERAPRLAPDRGRLRERYRLPEVVAVPLAFAALFTVFFSPAWASGRLLAPGDGLIESVPAFLSPLTLWSPLLLSGFPVAADMANMTWYPLSLLLQPTRLWNVFVLSSYVLAASFGYAYLRILGASRLAGAVTGIAYGLGGFMVARLGHTMIIHSAAWLPLLVFGIEALRRGRRRLGFASACLAIACTALAGHPQFLVYALAVAGAYALLRGASAGRDAPRFLALCAAAVALGLGAAAVQLVPAAELGRQTAHWHLSVADAMTFALPPAQALHLLFPYLFGGAAAPYNLGYFGAWNPTELTGYAGLLSGMLGLVAVVRWQPRALPLFWAAVAVLALLLAMGAATPLAPLLYHVPPFQKFRAPARHMFEFAFAVSVLAGLGTAAVASRGASRCMVTGAIALGAAGVLAGLAAVALRGERVHEISRQAGVELPGILPWTNPTLGIPVAVFALSALALFLWSRAPRSRVWGAALLAALVVDLGSFGWFYEWRYASPSRSATAAPPSAERYRALTHRTDSRVLPVRGAFAELPAVPPNLSRLWQVPSAGGYGPFLPARTGEVLGISTPGIVSGDWWAPANAALDLLAVRYVFLPRAELEPATEERGGARWLAEDLGIVMGEGCGANQAEPLRLEFGEVRATEVAVVSALGCSPALLQGTPVAVVRTGDAAGRVSVDTLRAGSETAEWAHDCPSVTPQMRHGRARVFESHPVPAGDGWCRGHQYLAVLPLGERRSVSSLDLEWIGPTGVLDLRKVSLIDRIGGTSEPLSPVASALADRRRWRVIETLGESAALENLRALPFAWIAHEAVRAEPEAVLAAIRTSRLPDGRRLDPRRVVLVEDGPALASSPPDLAARLEVLERSAARLVFRTRAHSQVILVVSETHYPGWRARVDDEEAPLRRANYVMRAVAVPPGEHVVELVYRPASVLVGGAISGLSLLALGLATVRLGRRRGTAQPGSAADLPPWPDP